MAAEKVEDPVAIKETEHFIRGLVAQTFPAIGIDVIHHEGDVVLCKGVERLAFGDKKADELMIAFGGAFLPGGLRVAVKDAGAFLFQIIQFDGRRIREFTAVIS